MSAIGARPVAPQGRTEGQRIWATFLRNRLSLAGVVLAIGMTAASAAAPLLTSWSPFTQDTIHRLRPPGGAHLLGQDTFGRDVFARILYAGRVSLLVGVGAVALGGVTGTGMGLAAGYYGGRMEGAVMRFVDILMAFPSLLL